MPSSNQLKARIVQLITESGCNVQILMQDFRHRCLNGLSMHTGYADSSKFLVESTTPTSKKDVATTVDRTIGGLYGMGINPDRALTELSFYVENRLVNWGKKMLGKIGVPGFQQPGPADARQANASMGDFGQPPAPQPGPDDWMNNLANSPASPKSPSGTPKVGGPGVSDNVGKVADTVSQMQGFDPMNYLNQAISSSIDQQTGAFDAKKFDGEVKKLDSYVAAVQNNFGSQNINAPGVKEAFAQLTQAAASMKANVSKVSQTQGGKIEQMRQELQQSQQQLQVQEDRLKKFSANMSRWITDAAKPDIAAIKQALKQIAGGASLQNNMYKEKPHMDPSNAYGLAPDSGAKRPSAGTFPTAPAAGAAAPTGEFAHTRHDGTPLNESVAPRRPRKTMYDW